MKIALIPARIGSKGVRRKNLQVVGGLSLVEHAVKVAEESKIFDKIIVSTDGKEVASTFVDDKQVVAFNKLKENELMPVRNKLVLHKRSVEDALDDAKTIQIVVSLFETGILNLDDSIMLLQPTSPFRDEEEICSIYAMFEESGFGVASVVRILNSHPLKSFQLRSNRIVDFDRVAHFLSHPRQLLPDMYKLDGAFYLQTVRRILADSSFLNRECYVFEREGIKTINIDSEEELRMAQEFYR